MAMAMDTEMVLVADTVTEMAMAMDTEMVMATATEGSATSKHH